MAYYDPDKNPVFWETPPNLFSHYNNVKNIREYGKEKLDQSELNHNLAFYSQHNAGAHKAFHRLCRTHAYVPTPTGNQSFRAGMQVDNQEWYNFSAYIQRLDWDALSHFKYDPDEGWDKQTDHYKDIFLTGNELPISAATAVLEYTKNPASPNTIKGVVAAFEQLRQDGLGIYWAGGSIKNAGHSEQKKSDTYGKGLLQLLAQVPIIHNRVWKSLGGCEEVEIIEEVMDELNMKSEELTYEGGWQFFIRTDYEEVGGWNGR